MKFRSPQIKYHLNIPACKAAKEEFFRLKDHPSFDQRKIVSKIATDYNIKAPTLRHWIQMWRDDPLWVPYNTLNHGKCHRIFQDDQEQNIADYIRKNYLQTNKYFSNAQFQTLAFEAFDNVYSNVEKPPRFVCSPNYISKFKKKI